MSECMCTCHNAFLEVNCGTCNHETKVWPQSLITKLCEDASRKYYRKALEDILLIMNDRLDHEEVRTKWVIYEIEKIIAEPLI